MEMEGSSRLVSQRDHKTGETYKSVVKVTFFKGAQMKDPKKLFNSSLEGNARRAIDFHEGDKVNGGPRSRGTDPRSCHSEHSVSPPLKAGGRDVPFWCQPSSMALRIRII